MTNFDRILNVFFPFLYLVNADGTFIVDAAGQNAMVELAHFQALYHYDNDIARQGIKLHPKLQEKDVFPDNFWVQKVTSATHLLSQSSVVGMKKLEAYGELVGSIASQRMASLFDELFDLCNTSRSDKKPSRHAIGHQDLDKITRLEEIRQHLLVWKAMVVQQYRLSNITINHWNVTIQSLTHCITFLFGRGWSFV